MKIRVWAAFCCMLLGLAACNEGPLGPVVGPEMPPDVRPYVVADALANLDEHGHFRLSTSPPPSPYPTISAEQARDIALGLIRAWFANPNVIVIPGTESTVGAAEAQHGGPIEWTRVHAGFRAPFVAQSHIEQVPLSLGESAVRHYSSRYLVPLFVDARPVVVVSISTHATNVYIDDRGFALPSRDAVGGGEWWISGTPNVLGSHTLPPSPEEAVRFAAESTDAKIEAVPVLGVPGNNVATTYARWELKLDRDVEFEQIVDGARVRTSTVFVGALPSFADSRLAGSTAPFLPLGLRLFVAAPEQPAFQWIRSQQVPIRSDYAVDLHQVRVVE